MSMFPPLTEPLGDRYTDLLDVLGIVHPQLRGRLDTHNRLLATLARRPDRNRAAQFRPVRGVGPPVILQ